MTTSVAGQPAPVPGIGWFAVGKDTEGQRAAAGGVSTNAPPAADDIAAEGRP